MFIIIHWPAHELFVVLRKSFGQVIMRRRKTKDASLKREIPQTIRFNSRELSALNQYCEKFKVRNKAKFMRETIITEILRKFDENYPTLWDDDQLRLF